LRELARHGAEVTLRQLHAEIAVIERTFPELSTARGRRRLGAKLGKRTRRMSAAARQAVSVRMKKYWAERRKVQKRMK
jgi:hypothetical protein